jgi:hypothetical protein
MSKGNNMIDCGNEDMRERYALLRQLEALAAAIDP